MPAAPAGPAATPPASPPPAPRRAVIGSVPTRSPRSSGCGSVNRPLVGAARQARSNAAPADMAQAMAPPARSARPSATATPTVRRRCTAPAAAPRAAGRRRRAGRCAPVPGTAARCRCVSATPSTDRRSIGTPPANNRYSQFLQFLCKRIRHTLSPWRLSSSSLMYSVDSFPRVAKLTSWSQSPGTKACRRSSITRGKAKIRL